MTHTPIPTEELESIKDLKDVKVIFDVGARADIDYFNIFPDATFHLFEPNPEFFLELKEKVGDKKNVFLNNYGLGDEEITLGYDKTIQCFEKGEAGMKHPDFLLPIKTLDWYIQENKIKRIDFIKIDTEGYDFKILLGGKKAVKLARYIQYEHWDNLKQFHDLLEKDFDMKYTGFRNVLCIRK